MTQMEIRPAALAIVLPVVLALPSLQPGSADARQAQPTQREKPAQEGLNPCGEQTPEYTATEKPALIEVGIASYLTITGQGAPGSEAFRRKIGAIYAVAYTVKTKSALAGRDYAVCPLEGLWWGLGGKSDVTDAAPESLNWKLLIRVPDSLAEQDIKDAVAQMTAKGDESSVGEVVLEKLHEGRCVQALHIGPYDKEAETIEAMLAFAKEQGLTPHGAHHEIYLSDPSRSAPEKLQTILRLPVK